MRWSNAEYDELAEELEDTVNREKRKEIGYRMQEILADEIPVVPVCAPDSFAAYRSDNFIGWSDLPCWDGRKVLRDIQPAQW